MAGDLIHLFRVHNHGEAPLSPAAGHVEEAASPVNGRVLAFKPVLLICVRQSFRSKQLLIAEHETAGFVVIQDDHDSREL